MSLSPYNNLAIKIRVRDPGFKGLSWAKLLGNPLCHSSGSDLFFMLFLQVVAVKFSVLLLQIPFHFYAAVSSDYLFLSILIYPLEMARGYIVLFLELLIAMCLVFIQIVTFGSGIIYHSIQSAQRLRTGPGGKLGLLRALVGLAAEISGLLLDTYLSLLEIPIYPSILLGFHAGLLAVSMTLFIHLLRCESVVSAFQESIGYMMGLIISSFLSVLYVGLGI